jgi:type IV pilus assembly protein PilO
MKITKREQVLLGALLIVLLGFGFHKFIYTKQNQKIAELKATRDTYSQKWEKYKVKIASKNKREEQYKTLNDNIFTETGRLFPSIEQEEIIVVLDKMIKESNLQADVLSFSEVSGENTPADTGKTVNNQDKSKIAANELDKLVSAFNETSKKDTNSEKSNNSKASANTSTTSANTNKAMAIGAYKMQVTFNFKGIYDELISFIKKVEDYNKKIVINNINLTATEGSGVSGTIILDFYGIPKLNNSDSFKWDYKKPSGNGDPFVGSSSALQVSNEVITNKEETTVVKEETKVVKDESKVVKGEIKSDFIMTAKPKTADLHNVTIEKAKDETAQSFIYADNEGIEHVEFYFTKIDNKYFYKYKTSKETYPKNFSNFVEFVPNGENIILDILSQKKGVSSDLSGANVKITNNTDKNVVANILNDDKNKPRVIIQKVKGNILVNRNYPYYVEK